MYHIIIKKKEDSKLIKPTTINCGIFMPTAVGTQHQYIEDNNEYDH